MKPSHLFEFVLLAALWGASFMFMRIAAPEFGASALVEVRVGVAALFLLPLLIAKRCFTDILRHKKAIFVVALTNTAIPYALFAFAALYLAAGYTAVINATAPLWAAIVGLVFFQQSLSRSAIVGLLIGFSGVILLVSDKLGIATQDMLLGIIAAFIATMLYGVAVNYSKHKLQGVNSLAITGGSMLISALLLLPLGVAFWPENSVSLKAWASVITMGVACTALALLLYFRLIEQIGPARTITVTYLIPVFGMFFGYVFLNEAVTLMMLIGCAFIILGTALTMGIIKMPAMTNKEYSK